MPKFIANKSTTIGAGGIRYVPIMIEEQGTKTPVVLVRQNVEKDEFTNALVEAITGFLNSMLDQKAVFNDVTPPKGELEWEDRGDFMRAQHPLAKAGYYIRRGMNDQYVASLGDESELRTIETSVSLQTCYEACEKNYQMYKSTLK